MFHQYLLAGLFAGGAYYLLGILRKQREVNTNLTATVGPHYDPTVNLTQPFKEKRSKALNNTAVTRGFNTVTQTYVAHMEATKAMNEEHKSHRYGYEDKDKFPVLGARRNAGNTKSLLS